MTPGEVNLLRDMIHGLGESMNGRFDGVDAKLARVEVKQDLTNGRVTKIETDRAAEKAASATLTAVTVKGENRQVRQQDYRRATLPSLILNALMALVALSSLAVAALH